MEPIETKRLEASILKSKSIIADMEVQKMERFEDIKRIDKNISQQEQILSDNEKKLKEASKT